MFWNTDFLLLYNKLQSRFHVHSHSLYFGLLVKIIPFFIVRNFHVNINMFYRHIQHISLPPPHVSAIFLTPFSQRNTRLLLSVGVEGGGEDDVPADGEGGLLHLAPQDGVSHDAGGLSHLLQHLVQALDAADHRALLDVCQLGDLCERL